MPFLTTKLKLYLIVLSNGRLPIMGFLLGYIVAKRGSRLAQLQEEFRGHVITQLKKMLSMKGTFTTTYRPQSNGLCECMNQTIENIIKCTKSLYLVMMAYPATPQTLTEFAPNMLVTEKETNMPIDMIDGSLNSRRKLHNYDCYCSYVEALRNSMVDAYFRTRTCLGDEANRQKMYYDRDTTPCHFKKADWVIYWHKPTAMQTLSSGWTGLFVVTEKASVVDYRIQLNLTGPSKVVHVDQLFLDPCHQDRSNWVRDEHTCQIAEKVIDAGNDPKVSQQTRVGVSIACQTSDTDPIVVSNKKK